LLSSNCHSKQGTPSELLGCQQQRASEKDMKIYLLMMLIGALLTAVNFNAAPKPGSKTISQ
jgi:hypothetical protein